VSTSQERNRLRIAAHNGKADPQYQRDQVAHLVSYVERIVHKLPEADQLRLRPITNQTCAAFGMPSIAERPIDALDFNLALVAHEMEQPQ
jgi:hypothetical protein